MIKPFSLLAYFNVIPFLVLTSRPLSDEFGNWAFVNGYDIWAGEIFAAKGLGSLDLTHFPELVVRYSESGQGFFAGVISLTSAFWWQATGVIGFQIEALILLAFQLLVIHKVIESIDALQGTRTIGSYMTLLVVLCAPLIYPVANQDGISSFAFVPTSLGWYGLLGQLSFLAALYICRRRECWAVPLLLSFCVGAFSPFASGIFACVLIVDFLFNFWRFTVVEKSIRLLTISCYGLSVVLWSELFFLGKGLSESGRVSWSAQSVWELSSVIVGPNSTVWDWTFLTPIVGLHSLFAFSAACLWSLMTRRDRVNSQIPIRNYIQLLVSLVLFQFVIELLESPGITYSAWWHHLSTVALSSIIFAQLGSRFIQVRSRASVGLSVSRILLVTVLIFLAQPLFLAGKARLEYRTTFERGGYQGAGTPVENLNDQYLSAILAVPSDLLPVVPKLPVPPYTSWLPSLWNCADVFHVSASQVTAVEIADAPHQVITGQSVQARIGQRSSLDPASTLRAVDQTCQTVQLVAVATKSSSSTSEYLVELVVHEPIFLFQTHSVLGFPSPTSRLVSENDGITVLSTEYISPKRREPAS